MTQSHEAQWGRGVLQGLAGRLFGEWVQGVLTVGQWQMTDGTIYEGRSRLDSAFLLFATYVMLLPCQATDLLAVPAGLTTQAGLMTTTAA